MEKNIHKTWLLDGLFHSAPGFITIEDERFKYTLVDTGTFSIKRLEKFEKYHNLTDSFSKLRGEKTVELLNVPLNNLEAKFPWYNFMGGSILSVKDQDQRMRLSFLQPQNTKFPYHRLESSLAQLIAVEDGIDDIKKGRLFGKRLKDILSL